MFNKDIDTYRRRHLFIAELIDAWRLIPRLVVGLYIWLAIYVILWYIGLDPYILKGCNIDKLGEVCIVQAPATQHAVALTSVFGLGAAVFGFYAGTGRKWNGFTPWKNSVTKSSKEERSLGE